jgi:hypothetical protein
LLKKLTAFALFVLLAGLILNATISSVLSNKADAAVTLPPVPAGLKSTFTLGLASQPGGVSWMNSSGAKWDARYQYLAGGVNTGTGWSTWNSPAGMFARYYMDDSANNGYLPALTYYNMLQSSPASGVNEADKDYNNLNNPSTMKAYYADFKLLMDQARGFGKTVIVHVEPDLWAFLQKRSTDPNAVSASVAGSGYGDVVASQPDNVAGFAKALVSLRNKYAPNVLLAFHISPWASSYGDLGSSKDPNFNVQGAAQETANFYLKTGANFDLLFYDIADRDAALYASWGDPNRWWDVNNTAFPNFNRFHQFVAAITSATGKRGIVWQIPIGNTLYRTMNNTTHHWQDNRVQYYLNSNSTQHLQDAANAGIIGFMFGAGDGQTTSYDDGAGDGVTNPAAINGNNLTTTLADDDGGYLRTQGQAYYAHGALTLPGSSTTPPTATPTTAAPTATAVPPTATIAPATTPVTGNGDGLSGVYFNNMSLSGSPILSRVDKTVNFNWGTGAPASGLPADGFSVRWTGQVKAQTSQTYTFCTNSDDGVRLWVNNVQLVNNWTNHAPTQNCGNIALTQGQLYSLKLEYYENSGGAVATLSWQTSSIAKQIVPQSQLYSGTTGGSGTNPTATPTTAAPTATPTKTATPAPTTAAPTPPASWVMAAKVSGTLTANSTLTVTTNFTAPGGANGSYLCDIEIYNVATGAKVAQWFPVQTFAAGQLQSFINTIQLPAGNYVVKLGVFTPSWGFIDWNDSAAPFQVS